MASLKNSKLQMEARDEIMMQAQQLFDTIRRPEMSKDENKVISTERLTVPVCNDEQVIWTDSTGDYKKFIIAEIPKQHTYSFVVSNTKLVSDFDHYFNDAKEVPAMSTDYLSKDTFEAHMKRMDERAAHSEALFFERMNTMQALMEKSLAEHRAVAEEIKGDVKTLGARLDAMENKSSRNVAWTGIIVGAIAALLQITIAVIK